MPLRPAWVDWSAEAAHREDTRLRRNLCLNNVWQFTPRPESLVKKVIAAGGTLPPPPAAPPEPDGRWYGKVPGRWDARGNFYLRDAEKHPVETIDGESRSDYMQGWYRRTVLIPEEWRGKKLFLDFDGISERATVFVNGKPGSPLLKTGREDITDRVRFGAENDLAVFVEILSLPVKPDHARFREFATPGMGTRWWYGWRPGPGISGDIRLRAVPAGLRSDKVFVRTDVGARTLAVSAELRNETSAELSAQVSAEVCDDSGAVFRIPARTVSVPAGQSVAVEISGRWETPRLWSPEQPALYTLAFRTADRNGTPLDEERVRFGFRDFTVGPDGFRLNGKKVRLVFDSSQFNYDRLTDGELRRAFAELRKMNFNGLIAETVDERVYRMADESGLMIAMRHVFPPLVREGVYLPGVPNRGYPAGIYLSRKLAGAKAELEAAVREIVEKFRNHPSLVIWAINPLLCYNSEWINPNRIDMDRAANDIIRASLREEAFLRSLDPTREVMHSMGSNTGNIIAANPYPNFSNQPDEWADWPSRWASRRKKPLVLEEVAAPFCFSFANWHKASAKRDSSWGEKRQLFYETGARYFGDSVYSYCRNDMEDTLWHQRADRKLTAPDGTRYAPENPVAAAVEKLWAERCFRAWRIYGVDGIWPFFGFGAYFSDAASLLRELPDENAAAPGSHPDRSAPLSFDHPSPLRDELRRVFAPFLAYLGGRPGHFTSRERNYYEGGKVEKTMLFANDTPAAAVVAAEWKVTRAGSAVPIASGTWSGELSPGETRRIPFAWTTPAAGARTEYRIGFRASANGAEQADAFDVAVFPKPEKRNFARVALYDEPGDTAAMLRKAGVPFTRECSGEALDECGALVVGRNSFTRKFLELSRKWNLPERIANGLKVTVLSQGTETELAEKLEERRARSVFVKDPLHPVLAGVTAADLADWRGESRAVTPYPDPPAAVRNMRFMHWGSDGCVASLLLDKPDRGNFRVVLDADFDLSRAALLELFSGKGRIVLCQLDLEDRYGIDPAATLLADNLFAYSAAPVPEPVRLVSAGPASGADCLRALGFRPETVSPETAEKLAEAGCVAVIREETPPEPEAIRLARLPEFPDAVRGLGNSDFYFNPAVRLPAVPLAVEKRGKGVVVRLRALPDAIPELYSRAKYRRAISTVLTNLGVRAADGLAFGPEKEDSRATAPEAAPFQVDPEDRGVAGGWFRREFDDSAWRTLKLGFPWETQGVRMENPHMKSAAANPYDGCAWYRIPVEIPAGMKGSPLFFEADAIDDLDDTWFNGVKIGHTGEDTPGYWQFRRRYPIPPKAVAWGGKNIVAVRVTDLRGEGGILGAVRITDGKPAPERTPVLYRSSPRNIFDFDPNSWRQW